MCVAAGAFEHGDETNTVNSEPAPLRRKVMRLRKKVQDRHQHILPPQKINEEPFRNYPPPEEIDDENAMNRTLDEKRCELGAFSNVSIKGIYRVTLFFFAVLSLFTIVSFQNDPCTSGTGNNGTCYSSSDCSRLGGSSSGSCASGFGVCCLCKF